MNILYLTYDGITSHLGHSQTLLPLKEINRQFPVIDFRIAALEPSPIKDTSHHLASTFKTGNIGAAQNLANLYINASRILWDVNIDIVHARGFLPMLVATWLKQSYNLPTIFDFRGYWVDELIEEGRWFVDPFSIRLGRALERHLFSSADAIVSLTEIGLDDYRNGRFGQPRSIPMVTIPTLVDTSRFNMEARTNSITQPRNEIVVGWVGSINTSYRVRESLELFLELNNRIPQLHLLAITKQAQQFERLASEIGIPRSDFTVKTVEHADVPQMMAKMDWGLLLLNESVAKRGSMPTKLGEFLAMGVRPIYSGCNSEMRAWIKAGATGFHYRGRADIAALTADITERYCKAQLMEGWSKVSDHFSLAAGAQRYANLYKETLR